MLGRSRQSSQERSQQVTTQVQTKKIWFYYYEIEPSKSSKMLKSVLEPRFWWKDKAELQCFAPEANLCWYTTHRPYNYDRLWAEGRDVQHLQMVNRLERGFELSQKENLYRNLWFFHKAAPADLDSYMPTTFSMRLWEADFHTDLQEFAKFFLAEQKGVKPSEINPMGDDLNALQKPMKVYHFFNTILPFGMQEKQFMNKKADDIKKDPGLYAGKKANLWIIKPSWLADGEGVEIFNSFERLDQILETYFEHYTKPEEHRSTGPKKRSYYTRPEAYPLGVDRFVIQKFVEKPMLYKGHKFDIKVFALYTQHREVYLFSESLVYLAAAPFDIEKLNKDSHMANLAVSCKSPEFGRAVPGNVISLKALETYLASTYPAPAAGAKEGKGFNKEKMHESIKKIVTRCFDSTFDILEKQKRCYNFELFSFDLIMDENFKLWLLEVNSGPSLEGTNEYSNHFMARMADDAFKMTIDQYFWKSSGYTRDFVYPVHPLAPFNDNANLWKFFKAY